MRPDSKEPKRLDDLSLRHFAKISWIAAFVFLLVCSRANALTLQEIERAYDDKMETLGAYQVEYSLFIEFKESGAVTSSHTHIERVLSSGEGYRIEQLAASNPQTSPVFLRVQTDDRRQFRVLQFTNAGTPDMATIRPADEPPAFYNALVCTPLGLAGLHDSAQCVNLEGLRPFMSDVRALSHDSKTVLIKDPVVLDGEEAYLLEWPAGELHPQFRFWLSKTMNLALLKYAYFSEEQGEFLPWIETRNTDFEEVAPGLFLLRKSEFRRREMRGLPGLVMTVETVSYAFEVVTSPHDYRVAFPQGIRVDNRALGLRYTQGRYVSLKSLIFTFNGLSKDTVSYVAELFTGEQQGGTQRTPAVSAVLVGIPLAVCLLVLLLSVLKSRRRARSRPE